MNESEVWFKTVLNLLSQKMTAEGAAGVADIIVEQYNERFNKLPTLAPPKPYRYPRCPKCNSLDLIDAALGTEHDKFCRGCNHLFIITDECYSKLKEGE